MITRVTETATRADPCTVLVEAGDVGRAVEAWVHRVRDAGWQVDEPAPGDGEDAGTVAVVDVEGIRYRLRTGPRQRTVRVDVGDGAATERPVLRPSVWAEPVLTADDVRPDPGPPAPFDVVRFVAVEEDADCFVVGIAAHEDGSGRHLLFQEPVDPDLVADSPTYCIVDDREASTDGGVTAVTLQDGVLELTFDEAGRDGLGLDEPVLRLRLDVDGEATQALRAGLERVLSYRDDERRPRFEA